MTRINLIDPKLLTNEWLIAEHREITRIPNNVLSGKKITNIPNEYTLGQGHEMFFRNKLGFIKTRYELLYKECVRRGINVEYKNISWNKIPSFLMNDYIPTKQAIDINIERLCERFDLRKRAYHFHRAKINCDYSFNRYLKILEKRLYF
jgi:deoxyribonuclease (pyrimidine dimer)